MALSVPVTEIVKKNEKGLLSKKDSWERIQVKNIAEVINGAAFKSNLFVKNKSEGLPLIRIRDIHNSDTEVNYVGEFDDKYIVNPGDIIIGMDGDFELDLWKGNKALLNQRVCKIIIDENRYNKKFFYYVMPGYLEAIHKKTSSVTVKHLSSRTIMNTPLPNPSLEEQELIVQKIETELSRLEDSVDSLKDVKEKLEVYRKSVLKAAFEGKLIKNHNYNWVKQKIEDIAKVKGGKRLPKGESFEKQKTNHPYLRVTDFENYSINQENLKYISEDTYKKISKYIITTNDIFISIAGTIGEVGIIPENLNFANLTENAAKITDIQNVNKKYLLFFLSSPLCEKQIHESTKMVAQPKLALYRIKNFEIIYPKDIGIQGQIVQEIESRFSVIDNVESIVDKSLLKAERLKMSILKSAFEGKLVSGVKA